MNIPGINRTLLQLPLLLALAFAMPTAQAGAIKLEPVGKEVLADSFRRSHDLSVGDKGEDKFPLKFKQPVCGKRSRVFSHAEIVFKKKRFSDAVIVRAPREGCYRCRPLVVRWYNEPTGSLDYELRVFAQEVEGQCPCWR